MSPQAKEFLDATHIDPNYFLRWIVSFLQGEMEYTHGLTYLMNEKGERYATLTVSPGKFVIERNPC